MAFQGHRTSGATSALLSGAPRTADFEKLPTWSSASTSATASASSASTATAIAARAAFVVLHVGFHNRTDTFIPSRNAWSLLSWSVAIRA